ncbi:hypothetical protein QQZ08_007264 [Neonectria magnoliae]|uniref:pectinesterase n=1 Tax=Neonectria magnoliae TaxID=2732573 RepID=A0ABR1HYC7_9HYPO
MARISPWFLLGLCAGSAVHAQTGSDTLSRRSKPLACPAKKPVTLSSSASSVSSTASFVTEASLSPQELASSSVTFSSAETTVSVSTSSADAQTTSTETSQATADISTETTSSTGTVSLSETTSDSSTSASTDESSSNSTSFTDSTTQTDSFVSVTSSTPESVSETGSSTESGFAAGLPEGSTETSTPVTASITSLETSTSSAELSTSSTEASGSMEETYTSATESGSSTEFSSTEVSTETSVSSAESRSSTELSSTESGFAAELPTSSTETSESSTDIQSIASSSTESGSSTEVSISSTESGTTGTPESTQSTQSTTESSSTTTALGTSSEPTSTVTTLTTISSSSTSLSTQTTISSSSAPTSQTTTNRGTAVTVATDGSGDYTVIGSAISYAQANSIPTVTVLAGTYTEAISVAATATVTVIGQTGSSVSKRDASSYASNKVTVTNGGGSSRPLTFPIANVKGTTWQNLNFVNSNSASTAGVVSLQGSKNAFYGCSFVAAGVYAVTGNLAAGLIANSYIEASDKVFYSYPSLYIFGSTIAITGTNGNLVYNKGYAVNSILYNSTVVYDDCKVIQKDGTTTKNIFLASTPGTGSVVLYRSTALAAFIAASGVHVDALTQGTTNQYLEYGTSGPGSYARNAVARSPYVTLVADVSGLSTYDISKFFGSVYPSVAVGNVDWIDSSVLSAIKASNAKNAQSSTTSAITSSSTSSSAASSTASTSASSQVSSTVSSSTEASSTASSSSTGSSSTVSSTASSSTEISSTSGSSSTDVSSTGSSNTGFSSTSATTETGISTAASTSALATTSSASATASCIPSSMPSTALVVGPASNACAQYTSISAAIAALPADSSTQYIYILAGTYNEQPIINRVAPVIFRGESSDPTSSSSNKVTIQNSNGRASSAGSSSTTATFSASKYETKLTAFYNINFVNTYSPQTNYVALAVYAKGQKVAFYGCNILSSQGTLYLDYGNVYFSGGRIEGTTDFVWGQGAGYIYNSVIVTDGTTAGQTIAAHKYQSAYGGSQFVFDLCAVVPVSTSVPKKSTYLGRDYSTNSKVAFVNSYLDAHIAALGWLVAADSTFTGSFIEGNNTGPGFDTSSRSSRAQILSSTSAYSPKNILGDDSWIDSAAIAPFSGWPDSLYAVTSSTSATTSATTTSSSTATSSATDVSTTASASTATASSTSVGSTLTVASSPTGTQYGTVSSAIAALPADGKDYTIYILAGTYEEQLSLTRRGKVTLRGESSFTNDFTGNTVLIKFSDGVSTSSSRNEETPILNWKNTNGDGLAVYNINFTNTFPQTPSYAALAADFYGTKMAAYGCAFKGFQDTLLVNQGVQVFSNSYVEGSVDFIWGYSKAYFHQCYVASNTPNAYITAQNRPSSSWAGGFVFDKSLITYTSSYGSTYGSTSLGRPWSQYAIVVYMNSFLDKHISPAGWNTWTSSDARTGNVLFGEFNNTGPGNWTSSRASFATSLTESQASTYSLSSFIGSTSWLDMTAYNLVPSYEVTKTSDAVPATSTTATADAEWAHPTSGTKPPSGAVLVSVDGSIDGSYTSLTDALASLPADSSTQIIFMYAGTYNEQVPSISRSGPVMIIGYTESAPGKTYTANQVIITQGKGLSVSPPPVGHSNAETATIATGGTGKIAMYNIDIINSDNLDGATANYVTLAASIYGNKIGFYGCSMIGWQDTLLTGATAGYQYYESCYIDGAIDFIWGYSKSYFKGCTLGAKRRGSSITAQSRASSSAIGGYIFDQCLFTAAPSATVDLTDGVYLGRPYSKYALVVVKNSYLDDIIQPAGWKIWSASDPRTDAITFAEYNNDGPGNWGNNSAAREQFGFATLLTSDSYSLETVMDSTDWIDKTYWDEIQTPQPKTVVTTPVDNPTTYDGTTPPDGVFIVSKTAIEGKTTYTTIQSALDALPVSSKTTAIVFIYPGTYSEKLVLSKAGTTIFLGYSDAPGDYTKNQVTITYNAGIDTQADASNSDSATVYATGNYFQAVNINFANTFGTASNYASLGFGVKSSKYAGLYGCQVYGNQDALLINGYLFASNSYVEGNIDMIWGSGAGYFLNSTIATNRDGIAITANKRADSATAAGFVFDQCTIKAAGSASYSSVSLGRPWNQYARVAYISSYLGSLIEATGWDQWTKSDPRTDGVIFGEMGNSGPGASTAGRASFATKLSASSAAQFELGTFFSATAWINSTFVYATPFVASAVVQTSQTTSLASTASTATTKTSSTSTSSVPSTTTVFTTSISTLKQTLTTTTTGPVETTTIKTTQLLDIGTTITPDPVTTTSFVKSTTTISQTVTEADEIVTKRSTELIDVGTTITPDAETETSWKTIRGLTTSYITTTAKASTLKTTITETAYTTSTPKATTTTQVTSSTISSTTTSTPKAITVKSTSTVTSGTDGETTVTAKATTSYVSVYTTSTKTTEKTTTISCIPANSLKKRGFAEGPAPTVAHRDPHVNHEAAGLLLARAAGLQTVTVTVASVYTTTVKTSTVTLPGSTFSTDLVITKTTGKVSTLKAETSTVLSVSQATKYQTTTVPGVTSTLTVLTTKTTGKTSTLKPSTVVVSSETSSTDTIKSTTTLPATTIIQAATSTRTITSVLDQSRATVTQSKFATSVETVILPASTVTSWVTVKTTLKPSSTVTDRATIVKTTTIKVSEKTTVWETRTSKNAKACPTA